MKTIDEYLLLPYTVVIRRDEEGDFVAHVDELSGCVAHGATREEAVELLEEIQREWIADALQRGHEVPVPTPPDELPSGKWVQRVPRSLHARLSRRADAEGVSLNHLVSAILAEALGASPPHSPSPTAAIPQATYVIQFVREDFFAVSGAEPFKKWTAKTTSKSTTEKH